MNYIKVSEAAAKWGISARRVRLLCEQGRIALSDVSTYASLAH